MVKLLRFLVEFPLGEEKIWCIGYQENHLTPAKLRNGESVSVLFNLKSMFDVTFQDHRWDLRLFLPYRYQVVWRCRIPATWSMTVCRRSPAIRQFNGYVPYLSTTINIYGCILSRTCANTTTPFMRYTRQRNFVQNLPICRNVKLKKDYFLLKD